MVQKLYLTIQNLIKMKIKKIIDKLNHYSPAIQVLFTIIILFSASLSIFQTQYLLRQQQKEEFIRLRPYVFPYTNVILEEKINKTFAYDISIIFTNQGQTPADYFYWNSYFLIKDNKSEEHNGVSRVSIGPGQSLRANIATVKQAELNSINFTRSSGNFIVVEHIYKTYLDRCFFGRIYYNFDQNEPQKGHDYLGIAEQEPEKEIECED